MLDRLVNLKFLSKEERDSLAAMKFILEKIRVLNKNLRHISDYLILEYFSSRYSVLKHFKL